MQKIGYSSRYYESFQMLLRIINYSAYYKSVYYVEKQTYSLPYLYKGYKNSLDETKLAINIYDSVVKFLHDNLFSHNEQILLIENLLPNISGWGNNETEWLNELKKFSQKYEEYMELEKTVQVLKDSQKILRQKINLYYSNLLQQGNLNKLSFRQTETEHETPKTFREYLKDLKGAFNTDKDYQQANTLIDNFFLGAQLNITQPIFVKGRNIKKLAFALGEVWRSKTNDVITCEYLEFYKQAFSIFKKQSIDRDNLFGCNLYKYSISKT